MNQNEITALLKKEMAPALGCTGPTAYGLATACCRPYVKGELKKIRMFVSPPFLKMGFGVASPGSPRPGIDIAAALGFVGGDYKRGLQVLTTTTAEDMKEAQRLVDEGKVEVYCVWDKKGIYVRAEVATEETSALAVVEHRHDGVSLIQVNGEDVFKAEISPEEEISYGDLTLDDIFTYIDNVPVEDIRFLKDEGLQICLTLAEAALKEPYGLASGRAFLKEYWSARGIPEDLFERPMDYLPDDILNRAKVLVAAASDGRMGGCKLPAYTAMGDGNQAVTAMIPVGVTGQLTGATEDSICRALALSCLMLFFIKLNIGRVCAFCLCAIAASAGAASGYGYLRGFGREQIQNAVKNVISPLAGMLCDGAKNGCALKMAIAATTALIAADLARDNVYAGFYDGVCDDSLEETVACITQIATKSMDQLDKYIAEGILEKMNRNVTAD